jgi:hypothetical protein
VTGVEGDEETPLHNNYWCLTQGGHILRLTAAELRYVWKELYDTAARMYLSVILLTF